MNVAVKLDEDLSPLVAGPLVESGYMVATVRDQGWGGLRDPELWSRLADEQRLFITADKGFADLRAYPPGSHAGILLLRPDRESILDYRALVTKVLAQHDLAQLRGALTVATTRSVRIRRKPL
jgi:predicted nuclease of predicted toxin-antitoxin system